MNREQVIATLEGYGAKVDEYDQGADADKFVKKGQVDEGYCRGVALDWIRRTVQGGKVSYPSGKTDHAQARTLRMATMQLRLEELNTLRAEGSKNLGAINSEHDTLVKLYNGHLDSAAAALSVESKKVLEKYWTFTPPLGNEISMRLLSECIEEIAGKKQAQANALNDMANLGPMTWGELMAKMDQYFQKERDEAGRKRTNKPFSGIKKGVSFEQRKQFGSAEAAATALLDELKQPWMAQLAGFGLSIDVQCDCPGGGRTNIDSGHAIAVLYLGPSVKDAYYLFEPNYGVFKYNREGAEKAIKFLFNPTQSGPYREDGQFLCKKGVQHKGTIRPTGGLRYTVFFPENPPLLATPMRAPMKAPPVVPAAQQVPSTPAAAKRSPPPASVAPRTTAIPSRAAPSIPRVPTIPRPTLGLPTANQPTPPERGVMSPSDAKLFWKKLTGEQ